MELIENLIKINENKLKENINIEVLICQSINKNRTSLIFNRIITKLIFKLDDLTIQYSNFTNINIKQLNNDDVYFFFQKNEKVENNIFFSVFISGKKNEILENELVKSLIHLLYENIFLNVHFISSKSSLLNELNTIEEAFSINLKSNEITSYKMPSLKPTTLFLFNLLQDLRMISSGEIRSPVPEINFNSLL